MAKFVLAYRGGSVPDTEAEQQAAMEAWMGWFGSLGDAVVDGGNPFGGVDDPHRRRSRRRRRAVRAHRLLDRERRQPGRGHRPGRRAARC